LNFGVFDGRDLYDPEISMVSPEFEISMVSPEFAPEFAEFDVPVRGFIDSG
jgi:hypothetical protein